MKKFVQLAALILTEGTLRPGGQNFNALRAKNLEDLREFIPQNSSFYKKEFNSVERKTAWFNNLIAQIAFIKASFKNHGGHLRVQNLAYIRIPKAANTSIGYAMLEKKYPALKEQTLNETQINFLSDVNLLSAKECEHEIFFTVVRNPFARLVSVYRDFFENDHPEFIYADYLFGIIPGKISFEEFVERINKIPDQLKDQHLKPQYSFIKPYEAKGVNVQWFKLEESQRLKSFLEEHGMPLGHRNKSPETYNYASYYNQKTLDIVYLIYQTDLHRFSYQHIYDQLKASVSVTT